MTNTEVVLAMYEEFFNGHDVNVALKYVKEDYIQHNPGPGQGRANLMSAFGEKFRTNPDFHLNIQFTIAEDDKVAVYLKAVDPQGNTTSGFGVDKNELENTIYELILGECSIQDCMIKNVVEGVSILPSNVNLAAAEIELIGVDKKEYILKNEVDYVKDDYDFIIIDCPPSLNMLTINSMTTADSVLVPIQCEYYALEGLSQLIHTINLVKERLNPDLRIDGVVFTMYDSRTNLSMQVVENVKQNLNQKVYNTLIPRNIRLAEAPSYGMPINMYDPKSAGAEAYMQLAEEVIKNK